MLALLLLAAASLSRASAVSIYVSPTGSDAASGTSPADAFASLPRAQAAVRAATAGGAVDVVVTVLPGVYVQPESLAFATADSGSPAHPVRWECAGAVLYVGVALVGWVPSGAGDGVWVTNATAQAPPPPPPPPPAVPGCGLVEPGISYDGNDIVEVLVPPNDVGACCAACAAQPGCTAWSLCVNITCGTPSKPVNCYLKSSASGRKPFGPLRTSGTLPGAAQPWRFSSLLEGARAATIARVPNRGSGYLDTLGVSNSDSSLTWPAGSPAFPNETFDVSNAFVFCNLGADWFTETRPVTGLDFAARKVSFEGRRNGVAGCNGKVFLQGPRVFVDEPGEFAFEPASGLLHYFPYDAAALAPGSPTPVIVSTAAASISFLGDASSTGVHDVVIAGLEVRGSAFTPDGAYRIFPPGRPNDTPAPTNTGMVRLERASRITLLGCKLLHAGLSAVFLEGATQDIIVDSCWIEGAGFCGVATNGVYPGDGPYTSADAAYVSKGLVVNNSLIYDVGKRVGHGAGLWLFQSGEASITNNFIKEAPRNGVGMYGVRFGAGAGLDAGVLPAAAYNVTLDFFSSLDLLTTRDNLVAFNAVENVIRDSCDGGAFESWGVGVRNVFHTNSVSDCDSGGVDGSWMNFLFQDDASHWLNHSSNVVFCVAGKGSEEATMIKSINSVFENNVIAYSTLGHAANVQPYIEPAAAMTFSRNVFAYLSTTDSAGMDISVNAYTAGDLAHSCSLMESPAAAAAYGFTNTTTPALSTPVIKEWDQNLWWQTGHNVSQVAALGWDTHALAVDPLFVAPVAVAQQRTGAATALWDLTARDLALQPTSPMFSVPGFRRINVERIGLLPSFPFSLAAWARRSVGDKVQAETYDRQHGLWREGSYAISGGAGRWPFAPGAWALYRRTDGVGATGVELRIQPLAANRNVSIAFGSPSSVVAVFSAAAAAAPATVTGTYTVLFAAPLPSGVSEDMFLVFPDGGDCVVDWLRLVGPSSVVSDSLHSSAAPDVVRTPSAASVSVAIDPSTPLGPPLSPLVFGANGPLGAVTPDQHAPYPLLRWGGNAATRYNYMWDVGNQGSDWFYLNERRGSGGESGSDVAWLDSLARANSTGLLTITTIGWVACSGGVPGPACNQKAPGFSVRKYGPQTGSECTHGDPSWCSADAGSGVWTNGSNVVGNDPRDTSVAANASYALAWLARLAARPSFSALRGVMLDNEPMLWASTHRDVHPTKTTYDELWASVVHFAAPIRAAYPHLEIHGPQAWGWCAYFNSASGQDGDCKEGTDRRAHGDVPLTQWLVAQLAAYHAAHGVLLITHLDVHAYPQAAGVDSAAEDEATGALRLRAVRMWDDVTYVDESWIQQPVMLLPRLRAWITAAGGSDLGLKLSISEFSFGSDSCVTAGVAHAETLAIFARDGVDEATVWTAPAPGSPSAQAWALFLSYDGAGSAVAGVPVNASSSNPSIVGSFAFLDGPRLAVVLTGKSAPSAGASSSDIAIAWPAGVPAGTATARAFGFSKGAPSLARLPDVRIACGAGAAPTTLALAPWSATLLEVDVSPAGCVAGSAGDALM